MDSIRFAIDLLWVRPNKVGGTEPFIRNLLEGMIQLSADSEEGCFEAGLAVSRDNADTFRTYAERDRRFTLVEMPVNSARISKRILWQNFALNRELKKAGYRFCFSPVYDRPFLNGGLSYVSVIHDLQALHFPEYHPFYEVWYSRLAWKACLARSAKVAAISGFVKDDIRKTYPRTQEDKLRIIYNPVTVDRAGTVPFRQLAERYRIESEGYYFTISQQLPHKNIETLLAVFEVLRKEPDSGIPCRLLVAGISGGATSRIRSEIAARHLEAIVTLTGYISDAERNTLYRNAKAFLFPSVFEGFGIPPVEAMLFGTAVITTRCACIPEVTQNLAEYVDDPYDPRQWIDRMRNPHNRSAELDAERYSTKRAAGEYMALLREAFLPQPGSGLGEGGAYHV